MSLNTFPCNPYPISTEELNKGNNDDLNTRVSALETAVEEIDNDKADLGVIAAEFDAEAGTYEIGDLVINEGKLYEFTSDHSAPGAWDPTEVTEKTVSDEIDTVKSGLIDVNSKITGAFSTAGLTTTGCDIVEGGYAKIGNLVFVQLLIKATSDSSIKINKFPKGVGPIGVSQYPPLLTADDSNFLFANFKSDGMEIFSFGQSPVIDNVYKVSCLYLAQ